MKSILCALAVFVFFVLFVTCANQGFPPGGPEDKTPPFILRTWPPADTTNMPQDVRVQIEFSEAVNPTTCQEALFITPFPGENVKYKWQRDKRLTIFFSDSLLKDRTYIITIGAGTKDRRNNAMQNSFTLAFSTGDKLDQGRIGGIVYGQQVEGTQIWAYDLVDSARHNPASDFPLYITQTGVDGAYRFTNVALSRYRLFAVLDRDVNTKYNVGYDMLGVAARDIALDSSNTVIENVNFRIALQDTLPPMVNAALAPDNRQVDIRFSEAMLPDCLAVVSNFTIRSENDSLTILNAAPDLANAAVVHLATSEQDSAAQYTLVVKQAFDLYYLPLLPDSNRAVLKGSALADTTRPRYIKMAPHDSSKFVMSFAPLSLYFSEAMQPESIAGRLVVADTLGDTIPGKVTWLEKSHFIFTPEKAFKSETFYRITLPVDSVFDLAGNRLADTLFARQFTSINPDTLTAISGRVEDADTSAAGPFYLRAVLADKKNPQFYEKWLPSPGLYNFDKILPGSYTIELYRDEDTNGRYSYGSSFPFAPAERFWIYPDTITVRARWPTEGEDILFK